MYCDPQRLSQRDIDEIITMLQQAHLSLEQWQRLKMMSSDMVRWLEEKEQDNL